jgi:glycosyltransferase involved in cell wall biosynthesis
MQTRQQLISSRSLFISFVVPIHNEEANIREFIPALINKAKSITDRFEIIMVNDGSKDNSLLIIQNELIQLENVKYLSFSRNFGKEAALTAGLKKSNGDVAILIDADFQHPLESIEDFVGKWAEGYDMVYGLRDTRNDESFLKRAFTKVFYGLLSMLSEVKIPPNAGDFRILDKKVVKAINSCEEYNRFMKGLYAWVGFKSTSIVYAVKERQAGSSSWSFFRLVDLALTGIISFSDFPLRVWSLIGMAISGIALLYALFIICDTLLFGVDVPGFATIVVAIMFFGGVQLISIGIIGEYISKIFREVKNRPTYIVEQSHGFDGD